MSIPTLDLHAAHGISTMTTPAVTAANHRGMPTVPVPPVVGNTRPGDETHRLVYKRKGKKTQTAENSRGVQK